MYGRATVLPGAGRDEDALDEAARNEVARKRNPMMQHHFSTTVVGIILVVVAGAFYGAIVLYGAWIDGKRQKVRDKGKHPVTEGTGEVHAREDERRNGSRRNG